MFKAPLHTLSSVPFLGDPRSNMLIRVNHVRCRHIPRENNQQTNRNFPLVSGHSLTPCPRDHFSTPSVPPKGIHGVSLEGCQRTGQPRIQLVTFCCPLEGCITSCSLRASTASLWRKVHPLLSIAHEKTNRGALYG